VDAAVAEVEVLGHFENAEDQRLNFVSDQSKEFVIISADNTDFPRKNRRLAVERFARGN
jgi:DICT domain-containing protein